MLLRNFVGSVSAEKKYQLKLSGEVMSVGLSWPACICRDGNMARSAGHFAIPTNTGWPRPLTGRQQEVGLAKVQSCIWPVYVQRNAERQFNVAGNQGHFFLTFSCIAH